jgi:hypothetical protein
VGPGRYGDLDGDGALGGPGEETAPYDCGCVVKVDKIVTIQSRDGAGETVLDAGATGLNVVDIAAALVVFGGPGKGFTLARGSLGVAAFAGQPFVRVEGNVSARNASHGFAGQFSRLRNNVALANGRNGFFVTLASEVTGNVAAANGIDGFALSHVTSTDVSNNVAVANYGHGFAIASATGVTMRRNAALGNRGFGIAVLADITRLTVTANNVYGNNSPELNGLTNCGLYGAVDEALDVTGNFWGSSDGPGNDPADDICNTGGASIEFEPFATTEFRVPAPALPRLRPPPLTD